MSTICFHCHFFCPAMRDFLSATEKVWALWLMISSDIVIWILHQSWYLTIKKNANATLSSLYRSVQYRESWRKKTPVFLWFCSYFCDLVHVLHISELLNHMTTILQSWNNQYVAFMNFCRKNVAPALLKQKLKFGPCFRPYNARIFAE